MKAPLLVPVLAIAGIFGAAVSSGASGDAVSLAWEAPAGCPDRDTILERLRSLLVVSKASGEQVAARGTVTSEPSGGAFHLILETVQGQRTWKRTMEGPSCDELGDAAALIIALVVDPDLMSASPSPADPVPVPASAAVPPASAPAAPPAIFALPAPFAADERDGLVARRSRVPFVAGAAAVADLGSLPRVSFGAEIALGVRFARAQIEATGVFFPSVRKVIRTDPEPAGGDFWLAAGGVRGCYLAPGSGWRWGLCGGVEIGSLHGEGFGTTGFTASRGKVWGAGRLGAFATHSVWKSLAFRGSLEGLVPVAQDEFVLENVDRVHKPSVVSGRLELGLEAHFE